MSVTLVTGMSLAEDPRAVKLPWSPAVVFSTTTRGRLRLKCTYAFAFPCWEYCYPPAAVILLPNWGYPGSVRPEAVDGVSLPAIVLTEPPDSRIEVTSEARSAPERHLRR